MCVLFIFVYVQNLNIRVFVNNFSSLEHCFSPVLAVHRTGVISHKLPSSSKTSTIIYCDWSLWLVNIILLDYHWSEKMYS